MPEYLYYCSNCDIEFEVSKSMSEAERPEKCSKCGLNARRRYTPLGFTFGWRLTDKSLWEEGARDELERNI